MAETVKHTRGEWVAQPGTTTGMEVVCPSAPKTRRVIGRFGGKDRKANAHMASAAPDMLSSLKLALEHPGNSLTPITRKDIEMSIAKAEGRS